MMHFLSYFVIIFLLVEDLMSPLYDVLKIPGISNIAVKKQVSAYRWCFPSILETLTSTVVIFSGERFFVSSSLLRVPDSGGTQV